MNNCVDCGRETSYAYSPSIGIEGWYCRQCKMCWEDETKISEIPVGRSK